MPNRRSFACVASGRRLLLALLISIAGIVGCRGQAFSLVDAAILQERTWKQIEPDLFTANGIKTSVGAFVRFTAKLVYLGDPVVLKLSSGATCRVTLDNPSDREQLGTSQQHPHQITVVGHITSVTPQTCSFALEAPNILVPDSSSE